MTQPVLPVELTHFVGREHELASLRLLASRSRLLTLTGPGGSGKSRLCLALLPQIPRNADDVATWVELAPLLDGALVPDAVLRALGAGTEGAAATADAVIGVLRPRAATLVLDNCEHLVDACAALADALLRACPQLRIIATSREALGVGGERAWLVPPLALPEPDADVETMAECDAVRLFCDRARDVLPEFALSAHNARAVAEICTRLDGIPLAIELAAARVRHMSPEQIRERLGDAFALLTTGARTALPRHRTLRATMDWSHDLLPDAARIVLRRLAVFRGGFTLDMVERVAAGGTVAAADVLDIIALLADRSLIVVREQNGVARYQLLETMRQYAQQRLEQAGEAEEVRGRLAAAVSALVAEVEPSFTTTARRHAFAQLEQELDNIRETLGWTLAHDEPLHARLVGMLWWFWYSTRHWVEAHDWIMGALALDCAAAPTRERARLLFAAGALATLRSRLDVAAPMLREAAAIARDVQDRQLEAYADNYIAMTYAARLDPEGAAYAQRAETWLRAAGDLYGLRLSLLLGGMTAHAAGDQAVALAKMEEAVSIARTFGQDRELAIALQTYATIALGSNDAAMVERLVLESLAALRRDPSFLFIARALDYYAALRAAHDPAAAARIMGIADGVRRHIGAERFPHDEKRLADLTQRLRTTLGSERFDRAIDDGRRVQPFDAIAAVLDDAPAIAVASAAPVPPALPTPPRAASQAGAQSAAADLDVRALGPFEVTVRGERIESWSYTKPKELLALLLTHPHGRTRTEIGAALWPDAAPSQVRNSFHVTMHHLRRTLGHADWLVLENERYRIAPGVTVRFDVAEFERRVAAALGSTESEDSGAVIAELTSALALYRDHFMAGESIGAWRDEVQDRLRRLYCDAGLRLGELFDAEYDAERAADAYGAVVAHEPLHETAHRGLLHALTQAGKRAHALRHYEKLKALLEQLELEPEPETEELYDRIRSADIVPGAAQSRA
jgi:predicted ATPase/DNA-binding SARP family transcriptional activator